MNWPLLLLVSFLLLVAESNEESVAYQPVSVGLTFGTPVDLTNTIQNVLTGPFGVVLTSLLGVVLLAGLLAPQFDHRRHRRSNDPMPRWYQLMNDMKMEDSFEYLGQSRESCRRKIICHVHNVLARAPFWLHTAYRIIRNIGGVGPFKEDIVYGLGGGDCQRSYATCPQSVAQLLIDSAAVRYFLNLRANQPDETYPD